MKFTVSKLRTTIMCCLMIPLILDPQKAAGACANALEMCIKTVIPGAFPFILLGNALAAEASVLSLSALERLLRVPTGTAGYFLAGLVSGYPVGAKLLQDATDRGELSEGDAKRMMLFCNNASPAFIIGILSSVFSSPIPAVVMWIIQIFSSAILGMLLPAAPVVTHATIACGRSRKRNIMLESAKAMVSICGWVIIFATGMVYIAEPVQSRLTPVSNVIIQGILELTNGLCAASNIASGAIAYPICAMLLSFGGTCVLLQTKTVAPLLQIRAYIFARALHSIISVTLATAMSVLLFRETDGILQTMPLCLCAVAICVLVSLFNKKVVAIRGNM